MNAFFSASLAVAALAASAIATPVVGQQAKQDFVLVNRTGYELSHVYVAPNRSNDWENDVLGQDTLEDGQGGNIRFNRSATTCLWDLKVVYSVDNSNAVWSNIDLCNIERITIRYNKNSDTTSASFD